MSAATHGDALANRLTARPLDEDCTGGTWTATDAGNGLEPCESCGCETEGTVYALAIGGGGSVVLCRECAVAECERAEAAGRS